MKTKIGDNDVKDVVTDFYEVGYRCILLSNNSLGSLSGSLAARSAVSAASS